MFEFASHLVGSLFGAKSKDRRKTRKVRDYDRRLSSEPLEARMLLAQVGVTVNVEGEAFDGYTLFAPTASTMTYLIDNEGHEINSWKSNFPPMSAYLMEAIPGTPVEDGDLLRAGRSPNNQFGAAGASGKIELFDWDGTRKWAFGYSNAKVQMHHDIEMMPNGNILAMAWEKGSYQAAVKNGRDPALLPGGQGLWPERIIEIKPNYAKGSGGTIVWRWRLYDHLVQDRFPNKANYVAPAAGGVAAHPELVDINWETAGERGAAATPADWVHWNGIDYNADLDQICISGRDVSEFWIIDHSTTTAQAKGDSGGNAGQGGDLLYRWGNPRVYKSGDKGDQTMFYQHAAEWIPDGSPGAGRITVFDNGGARVKWVGGKYEYIPLAREYSTAIEVAPVMVGNYNYDWTQVGADVTEWQYIADPPTDFYSNIISNIIRLPNGNTLIDEGTQGRYFEVNLGNTGDGSDAEIVWEYVNPVVRDGPLHQGDPIPPAGFIPGVRDNWTFRAYKYATNSPIFAGKDLMPKSRLEYDPADAPGLYVPGDNLWYLNDRVDGTIKELTVVDGPAVPNSWIPVAGNWNGLGGDTIGLYNPSTNTWYLNNEINGDVDDLIVLTADPEPTWKPVVGDWDGDGDDTPGLYDPSTSTWYLNNNETGNLLTDVVVMKEARVRPAAWRPIAGDWDGDGTDTVGLYVPDSNRWLFHHDLDGVRDAVAKAPQHKSPWWQPITGDWNSDGSDGIGLYDKRTNSWYLNNDIDGSIDDLIVVHGPSEASPTWLPIVGDWDDSGPDKSRPLMLAAEQQRTSGLAQTLTEDQLAPVFDTAVRQVGGVEGIGAAIALSNVSFEIVDLPGLQLGRTVGRSLIQIDVDAAGRGWSSDDSADDRADLLTAVMHELGHALGYGHSEQGVMRSSLALGTLRLWQSPGGLAAVDAAFT